MQYLEQVNHRECATGSRPRTKPIQERIHAMLQVADTDDMDALLAIVARILAARLKPGRFPLAWISETLIHLDEIELLFSLELFSMGGTDAANA